MLRWLFSSGLLCTANGLHSALQHVFQGNLLAGTQPHGTIVNGSELSLWVRIKVIQLLHRKWRCAFCVLSFSWAGAHSSFCPSHCSLSACCSKQNGQGLCNHHQPLSFPIFFCPFRSSNAELIIIPLKRYLRTSCGTSFCTACFLIKSDYVKT